MWLGALLLALPFLALFAVIVCIDGWRVALAVFAITAAVVAVIIAGAALLSLAA